MNAPAAAVSTETKEPLQTWVDGRVHRGTLTIIPEAEGRYSYCVRYRDHRYWSPDTYASDELPALRMMAWTDLRSICQRPLPSF